MDNWGISGIYTLCSPDGSVAGGIKMISGRTGLDSLRSVEVWKKSVIGKQVGLAYVVIVVMEMV